LLRGVFVTGTDTGVGKTIVSAALVHRYRSADRAAGAPEPRTRDPLRYWKPVQTGTDQDNDTATVQRLGCGDDEVLEKGVRLPQPFSPHLAARLAGRTILVEQLLDIVAAQPGRARWVVEGAGGVLVPLNAMELMIDLMSRLGLPALVVSRTTLGTINHTLLTLEALRARSIAIAGVVMVGERNRENRDAIETYGRVPVVGELPLLSPLGAEALRRWAGSDLDRDGRLREALE
jgi:dethiobiotin synthase